MKKIVIIIKKFLGIIISLIYGLFKKDKNADYSSKIDKSLKTNREFKNVKKHSRIIQEDEESEKTISSFDKSNNQEKDVVYYAKRDIQKLLFIKKNIIKLEYKINECNDLDDIYLLQNELNSHKLHYDAIARCYEKINIDVPILKDLKELSSECNKILEQEDKIITKKISILKDKSKTKENKEIIKEEENVKEQDEIEKASTEIVEPKTKIEETKTEIEEPKTKIEETKTEIEEPKIEVEEVVEEELKESTKIFEENKVIKSISLTNIDDLIIKEDNTNDKKENLEVELEKDSNIREISLDAAVIALSINKLKNKKQDYNLKRITSIVAEAHALAANLNLSMMLQINPTIAVSSVLHINNEIRKAQKINDKKVTNLKLDKVVNTVGLNPLLQVRFITTNSISQIRKLKSEIQKYGNTKEVIDALNELTELELELLMQLNELQQRNTMQQGIHR